MSEVVSNSLDFFSSGSLEGGKKTLKTIKNKLFRGYRIPTSIVNMITALIFLTGSGKYWHKI